jgi:hypothetical protein
MKQEEKDELRKKESLSILESAVKLRYNQKKVGSFKNDQYFSIHSKRGGKHALAAKKKGRPPKSRNS